jgi:hypothetical protein
MHCTNRQLLHSCVHFQLCLRYCYCTAVYNAHLASCLLACSQVLDKQLQHTLSLGYVPILESRDIQVHVRAAVAEVRHRSLQWRVTDLLNTVSVDLSAVAAPLQSVPEHAL